MIHLFYCSNSTTESELRSLQDRFAADALKMLGLPCSGKITIPYLVKAFEKEADGVVLCCCQPAECRNLEGTLRAAKRAQAVDALMEEVGLGKGRVLVITRGKDDIDAVIESIQQFETELQAAPALSRTAVIDRKSAFAAGKRRETAA